MMLLNMHRIGVPFRQVLLQIFFEIVLHTQPVHQLKHAQRVVAPIGVFRNGDVVCPANLVEVNKAMRCLHHGKAVLHAQGRLQAHPRQAWAVWFVLTTIAAKKNRAYRKHRQALHHPLL